MQTTFIGVDVAKAEFVIRISKQAPIALKNDASAIAQWLSTLPWSPLGAITSNLRTAPSTHVQAHVLKGAAALSLPSPNPI